MPQTAVTLEKPIAMEGQLDECAPHFRESLVCDEANGIPFGRAVALKTPVTKAVDLVATTSEAAAAYAVVGRNPSYPSNDTTVASGDGLTGVRFGIVTVKVEDAVTAGDAPFIRFAAGASLTALGRFRSDDGNEGGGALASERVGWEYLDSADAGGYARVWVK